MEFGLNCAALFVGVAGMHFVSFTQAKQQRPKEGVTTQGWLASAEAVQEEPCWGFTSFTTIFVFTAGNDWIFLHVNFSKNNH